MRKLTVVFLLFAAALPVVAQQTVPPGYRIRFDPKTDVEDLDRDENGKQGIFVKVRFVIEKVGESKDDLYSDYKIIIKEDGTTVREVKVPQPKKSENFSAMLCVDMSGSMEDGGKVKKAKDAGEVFFVKLPAKAECGLIIFDHKLRQPQRPPTKDREEVRRDLLTAEAAGGTAYLDASARAIELLKDAKTKGKAVVVMTDGVDLNSKIKIENVVMQANLNGVRIYTVGIGEPGRNTKVTSVLALDKSGSMNLPASDGEKVKKIDALKAAASRFVGSMRKTAQTTVLEFSDGVRMPDVFSNDRDRLVAVIERLNAKGETAVFDAAYAAVATLEAEDPAGKRAVVVLTDGIDNSSRHRAEEVVNRAKEAKIPLHMLAFGRDAEIDAATMRRMADQTGGKFFHAKDEESLLRIFENLSIQLHDDGIDEDALKDLANKTGGAYFPAKDISRLELILAEVTEQIVAKEYSETFASLRQVRDGTARRYSLELVRRGETIQQEESTRQVRGVIIAEMHPYWYGTLLLLLGVLVALPSRMKSIFKGGTAA